VAVGSFGTANNLRFAVPGEVGESRRFVVRHVEDDVLLPMAVAALGILVPSGNFTGKPEDENVVPAVLVEIVGEGEEIVGVSVIAAECAFEALDGLLLAVGVLLLESLCGGIIFVAYLEVRPFIPVGAGDDVHFAVVIEIAEVGSFTPELVVELGFLEGVQEVILSGGERSGAKACGDQERDSFHG